MRARAHLAVIVAFALTAVVAACGRESRETTEAPEAPGFTEEVAAVDRSPFELARPRQDGAGSSTTLPSGPTLPLPPDVAERVRPGDPSNRTTTTTSSTTTTTTTTTTIPDTRPVIRRSGTIGDLCGLHRAITSSSTLLLDPSLDVVATHNEIKASLNRYAEVAPAEWRARVELVRAVVFEVADMVAASDYSVNAPAVQELIYAVSTGQGRYGEFLVAVDEIQKLEQWACR